MTELSQEYNAASDERARHLKKIEQTEQAIKDTELKVIISMCLFHQRVLFLSWLN